MAPSAAVSTLSWFIRELRKIKRARSIELKAAALDANSEAVKNGWAVRHDPIGDPDDDLWPDAAATGYVSYLELLHDLEDRAWKRAEEKAKGARKLAKWNLGRALAAMRSDCQSESRRECRQRAGEYCDKLYTRFGGWTPPDFL